MTHVPLVQMIITVQFAEPIPPLNALDIARFYESLEGAFPQFGQTEPAGPMPHRFSQLDGTEPPPVVLATMPRIQLSSVDGTRALAFQNDRLTYGWQRRVSLREEANYPGFKEIVRDLDKYLATFTSFIGERFSFTPNILATEIVYTDALPLDDADGTTRSLSSIFTFLAPPSTPYHVKGFDYSWNELLENDGILSVRVYGPIATAGDIAAALLQTTAAFASPAQSFKDVIPHLNKAHERIISVYERVVAQARREEY